MTHEQSQPKRFPARIAFHRSRLRSRQARRPALEPLEGRALMATFNVPAGNPTALIQDIQAANSNTQVNTINLAPISTYILYGMPGVSDGLPAITKDLTINGYGSTIERSALSFVPNFRLIEVDNAQVSINDLTREGGSSIGGTEGAGLAEFNGNVTLTSVNVMNNKVSGSPSGVAKGGGLAAEGGSLTLNHVNVSGNVAQGGQGGSAEGGGLSVDSGAVVVVEDGTTISQNQALGGVGTQGAQGTQGANGSSDHPSGATGSNGQVGGSGGQAQGGGIYVGSGQVTVTGTTFDGNAAVGGNGGNGGIGGFGGNANLHDFAWWAGGNGGAGGDGGSGGVGQGGGLYQVSGSIEILNSTFSANQAISGAGGLGGGGGQGGNATSTWFGENPPTGLLANAGIGGSGGAGGDGSAGSGGAVFTDATTFGFVNSTIADCSARGGVAGIGGVPGEDGGGTINGRAGTIGQGGSPGNGVGGGLEADSGTVTLTDATVAFNDAFAGWGGVSSPLSWGSAAGAGIYVPSTDVLLNNSLVADNIDDTLQTGALGVFSPFDTTNPDDVTGPLEASSSYNLFGVGGSGLLANGVDGNQVGVATTDLGSLANNGGPTQTVALLAGSPAIAHGSSKLAVDPVSGKPLTTDQRGAGFVRSVLGVTDIGAYEYTQVATSLSLPSVTGTYGGSVTLNATLTETGTPVSGEPVSFNVGSASGVSAETNSHGVATVTVSIAAFGAGSHAHEILAAFGGGNGYASSGATANLTVMPAILTVTANNMQVFHDQSTLPAPSDTITGFVNNNNQSIVKGNAAFGALTPATDQAGTYPIQVSQGTLSAANYTFKFVNGTETIEPYGAPSQLTITAGHSQSAPIDAAFGTDFQVAAKDSYGNPVPGLVVTFSVTTAAGKAGGTFPGNVTSVTATTSANGVATASAFIANNTTGSFTVSASLPSGSGVPAASFQLTNTATGTITVNSASKFQAFPNLATGTIQVASFNDPSLVFYSPTGYTASINWGDGTTATTGTVSVVSGSLVVSGNHTYQKTGVFDPMIKLTHTPTGRSATATGEADVATDVTGVLAPTQSALTLDTTSDGHKGQYRETLTLTNTGSTSLMGTYDVVFSGLATGVGLGGSTTGTLGATSGGLPYIQLKISPGAPLARKQSMTVTVWLSVPASGSIAEGTLKVYQTG
jgi:hypothetical protein